MVSSYKDILMSDFCSWLLPKCFTTDLFAGNRLGKGPSIENCSVYSPFLLAEAQQAGGGIGTGEWSLSW